MKIKVDEDLPNVISVMLREAGHDAVSVREQKMNGWKDHRLWIAVQQEGRFLITADKGFGDLRIYSPGTHHGVLILRPDEDGIRPVVDLLGQVLKNYSLEDFHGSLAVATPETFEFGMDKPMPEYEAVIGLETHIQLNTQSKIFCACKADSTDAGPNTNICPVCTGMPGVLPVLNRRVVEKGVLLAAAMHAEAQPISFFDRKNYFYPDLPKGYQISQYDKPLATGGYLDVPQADGSLRRVGIWKLHIEEDAGKTKNALGHRQIDFNRCGVPLVEMVTAPDLRSADEAANYLTRLRQLLRWIGVSEADMEKGHLRCDANVSLRLVGATTLNTKTEIKNVNSIEAVRAAIEKEIERQTRDYEAGVRVESWTLEWDEDSQSLKKMRSKETEADYRYFREPDLLPVHLTNAWKASILGDLPELPLERRQRFVTEYGLPAYDSDILTGERSLSDYFELTVKAYGGDIKKISNWLLNDVLRLLNDSGQTAGELKLTPAWLAEIIKLVDDGTLNANTGKSLLQKVNQTGKSPSQLVADEGLARVSDDSAIRAVVAQVIAESPVEVAGYKGGKLGLMGWFVGQVMKKMQGKADAQKTRALLEEMLK